MHFLARISNCGSLPIHANRWQGRASLWDPLTVGSIVSTAYCAPQQPVIQELTTTILDVIETKVDLRAGRIDIVSIGKNARSRQGKRDRYEALHVQPYPGLLKSLIAVVECLIHPPSIESEAFVPAAAEDSEHKSPDRS